jgi:hypothetical protein
MFTVRFSHDGVEDNEKASLVCISKRREQKESYYYNIEEPVVNNELKRQILISTSDQKFFVLLPFTMMERDEK